MGRDWERSGDGDRGVKRNVWWWGPGAVGVEEALEWKAWDERGCAEEGLGVVWGWELEMKGDAPG